MGDNATQSELVPMTRLQHTHGRRRRVEEREDEQQMLQQREDVSLCGELQLGLEEFAIINEDEKKSPEHAQKN